MVRLNIDALKVQDSNPATPGDISAAEASILSVNQVEVAPEAPSVSGGATETTSTPSTLDLIESDEVKFWVDFYDNSLAQELGSETAIADLLSQGIEAAPSPAEAKKTETPPKNTGVATPTQAPKLSLVSLATGGVESSVIEAKPSLEETEKKVDAVFSAIENNSSSETPVQIPESTPKLAPKIGIKLDQNASKVESGDSPKTEKSSDKIEDVFPNLIVGFEEDEKVEYAREVAKTLSESRKGGLKNLFGKNALIHSAIAIAVITGFVALSIIALPKIFGSIKGSSLEFHKFSTESIMHSDKTPPRMENSGPNTQQEIHPDNTPVPSQKTEPLPLPENATPVTPETPINTPTPPQIPVQPTELQSSGSSYTEWVDFQVMQGNKKNGGGKK